MAHAQSDIRWHQRLQNYAHALARLTEAVELAGVRPLSALEQQGLIQAFEFTHELAWNLLKDYFFWQGNGAITGSRDATREGFAKGLLEDGEGWMEMIKSRNQSSHTYNQAVADAIANQVVVRYYALFQALQARFQMLRDAG